MLTLNKKFNDSRAIKVLVVPIGDNSLFDRQFEIVSKRRSVPMYELNRPSADGRTPHTPFKSLNWDSGALLFDYLRFDRVSSGQGDLDTFQCNRRYLHVIGLINYPELEGSKYRLEEDMDYYTRRYPNVILRRYFVFNMFNHPSSNSWTIPSIPNDPNAIVVFPPDGECEGGNNMIDIHLHEVMAGVALKLLLALETQAVACEDARQRSSSHSKIPPGMNLFTMYDEMEEGMVEGGSTGGINMSNASSKMKRRVGGRLRKITADLCLQACSPLDALENFMAAITECKNQGDSMWLAGSYEGFATSILWCLELRIPLEEVVGRDLRNLLQTGLSTPTAVIKLVEERSAEALGLYARNIAFAGLEVECSLKIARMYEEAVSAGLPDREQKVMEFLLRAVSVPGLNRQQQMECTLEAAFVCSRMNLRRKYAFFLFLAALFAADSENSTVTHLMMKCALQQYGINFNKDTAHAVVVSSVDSDDLTRGDLEYGSPDIYGGCEDGQTVGRGLSWASMRRVLYAQCAHFGKEAGDVTSAARCLAGMLRLVAESDSQWRKSTAQWLPRDFQPDDLLQLFLTCSTASIPGVGANGNPQTGSNNDSENLNILTRSKLERMVSHSQSDQSSPVATSGMRSPVTSSLTSSHTMASFRKIYAKGNYRRLHAKMRTAGGRILDLHENITAIIDKKQMFDFSLSGKDDRDVSDVASEAGSVRAGGFVQGFLNDGSSASKSYNAKRKVAVPKLDAFVASLTYRLPPAGSQKLLPRTASLSSVPGTISGFTQHADSHSTDLSSLAATAVESPGAGSIVQSVSGVGGSIFSFGNAVTIPNSITSKLLSTPEGTASAMIAAGMVDDTGAPNVGALTPATNCISRTWLGGSSLNNASGLEKLKPLQEGCVRRLEMCCEDVPPSCPVYLGQVPLLVSMEPMSLPENSRPYPTSRPSSTALKDSTKSVGDASALYYDPFLAKRDKQLKESCKGLLSVVWACGMSCKVAVTFTNPLLVPIKLSNVVVILEEEENKTPGKFYEVTPENIEIPSVIEGGTQYTTILSVTPTKICKMKLIGMRYFIRNAIYVSVVGNDGRGTPKSQELCSPWTYPRRAREAVDSSKAPAQATSMVIQVTGRAADVRMQLSWSHNEGMIAQCSSVPDSVSASASIPPKEVSSVSPGLTATLNLGEGECRRESIIMKNLSGSEIEDFRLSMMSLPLVPASGSATLGSRLVLLPWGGPLRDNDAVSELPGTKKISARAAAAISDHKKYVEEKEKIRLGQLSDGAEIRSIDEGDDDTPDISFTEYSDDAPFVRVVAVEPLDYSNEESVLPIPPFGSIRVLVEFRFRSDILLNSSQTSGRTSGAQSTFSPAVGSNVSFTMSYLSSDSNNSIHDHSHVLHYRNYTFDTIVRPIDGIRLIDMFVSCPGSQYVGTDVSDCGPTGETAVNVALHEDQDCGTEIEPEGNGVVEQLAKLLAEDNVSDDMNGETSPAIQVHGNDWYLVFQWENQFDSTSYVCSDSSELRSDGVIPDPPDKIRNMVDTENSYLESRFFFEDSTFFQTSSGDNLPCAIAAVLSPHSRKNIYVKLGKLSYENSGSWDKKIVLRNIRQKLKSLYWCNYGDCGLRKGLITTRLLRADIASRIGMALQRPAVQFAVQGVCGGRNDSCLGLGSVSKKTYQLAMPVLESKPLINTATLVSFTLPSTPISSRKFYNFNVSASLACNQQKLDKNSTSRKLELAVVVFEGHHVGLAQVGPGTGRASRARLGASYILPIISVDPLPAAAAAAVAIASSSSMHNRKSISLVEVGSSFADSRNAVSTEKEDHETSAGKLAQNLPAQSRMVCAGVLVSGQLRRVFDIASWNYMQPVEHEVKLCFTNCGKYTIYTLAREWENCDNENRSAPCGTRCEWKKSPWQLDPSPFLLTVDAK